MNKIMYEVNWHYKNDVFSHCTVTPITVIREGVLPGCEGESITAIGADGRKFLGTAKEYFNTEVEAWGSVRLELLQAISARDREIEELTNENFTMHKFLCAMPEGPDQGETPCAK